MKQLSKIERQRREYNKYMGFLTIKKNYENLLEKNIKNVMMLESVHKEFLANNRNVKGKCGIRLVYENKYERQWVNDYNKLKIKLKKMC